MRCEIVLDWPPRPLRWSLELPPAATVAAALQAAREHWATLQVDWDRLRVGVWGVEVASDHELAEGDRVELYRELPQDPREARRRRVRRPAR